MSIFPVTTDVPFTPRSLWWNGKIVPWASAAVHVSQIGHASISSVFEGIKAYWSPQDEELFVFRLNEHIERFMESIRMVRLATRFSAQEIVDGVVDLLRANETRADVYIRPWVYASSLVREMMVPAGTECDLVIDTWWFNSKMLTDRGCSAIVTSWSRIDDGSMPPRIKAFSNYHNSRLGVMEARQRGADWPIFLNRNAKVTEGPASCIVMIRRGELITPPLSSGILDSITRRTILEIAPEVLDMPVVERDIDRTELYVADELFYCGTGWEILPIVEVDGLKIGKGVMGPCTKAIDHAYWRAVHGRWTEEWCTEVWSAVAPESCGTATSFPSLG